MAEDIGLEPCFDIEDKPVKEKKEKKKAKKPERSAPVVTEEPMEVEEVKEDEKEDVDPNKPLSRGQVKKMKKRQAKEMGLGPHEKMPKLEENQEEKKEAKHKGKDKKLSFEVIEVKYQTMLSKLVETTNRFKEGEAQIKQQVEEGKILKEEAETLYRVYNRALRHKRLKERMIQLVGEQAPIEVVKEKINTWVQAGKVTKADAGNLVYRWKARTNRREGRQNDKIQGAACYHCREPGHVVSSCPKRNTADADGVCFKCGSLEHAIAACKKKNVKGFPFATCFVCKQVGHISRDCHQNHNGVYPDGGCCNVCGNPGHLRRDCPELAAQKAGGQQKKQYSGRAFNNATESADADYDPTEERKSSNPSNAAAKPVKKVAKHIKF